MPHDEAFTRIDGIEFHIDGDNINLEQDMGCGEMSYITLHRIHLAHIATMAGLLNTDRAEQESAARFRERLDLLAAMVLTHTRPGDHLRAAVAILAPGACAELGEKSNGFSVGSENTTQEKPSGFSTSTKQAPVAIDATMTLPGIDPLPSVANATAGHGVSLGAVFESAKELQ